MFGPWLALTVRALRVDSRSWLSHTLRLVFVLIVFFGLLNAHLSQEYYGAPGLHLFTVLSGMNLFFISLAAVSMFATPITEEKEEATLGLLRMAGIGPLGLLLGKSTTCVLTVLLILLVQFPFILLSITLGGVLWEQVLAHYLAAIAYLVLAGNLGLFCSVVAPRSSNASFMTGVLLLLYLLVPGILVGMFYTVNTQGSLFLEGMQFICMGLLATNVWVRQAQIVATSFPGDILTVQVWSNLGAGLVLFIISWLTFDFFTRNHLVSVPARGGLLIWRKESSRRSGLRRMFSPGRVWSLPFAWKDFAFIAGGWPVLITKFLGYFLIILGVTILQLSLSVFGANVPLNVFGGHAIWLMLLLGGLEMALLSSKVFREETRWQTLSALLMLPSSPARIAYAKVGGCLLSTIPAFFWLGVGFVCCPEPLYDLVRYGQWDGVLVTTYMVMHYAFFLHLTAYLSLLMKWGALPAALGAMVFMYVFGCSCLQGLMVSGFFGMTRGGGASMATLMMTILILVHVVLMGFLQVAIVGRLVTLAERA